MNTTNFLYALTALLMLSVGINILLLVAYSRLDTKARSSKPKNTRPDKEIIRAFLEQQFESTRKLLSDPRYKRLPQQITRGANINHVIALRSAYLRLERNALAEPLDSWDYHTYIVEKIATILKTYMPSLFGQKKLVEQLNTRINDLTEKLQSQKDVLDAFKANPIKHLQEFEKLCEKAGPEESERYLDKLDAIVGRFDSPDHRHTDRLRSNIDASRKKLISAYDELDRSINRQSTDMSAVDAILAELEESLGEQPTEEQEAVLRAINEDLDSGKARNVEIRESVDDLKSKVNDLSDRLEGQPRDTIPGRISINAADDELDTSDLKTLSDEIQELNSREIDRLRNIVRDQKSSIYGMEDKIRTLESELTLQPGTTDETRGVIDQLKRTISESEMCIQVLESEIDNLREELDRARLQPVQEEKDTVTEEDVQLLNSKLESLNKELAEKVETSKISEILSNYVKEAMQAKSLEDMAFLIFDTIQQTGGEPGILIKNGKKELVVSASGKLSPRDRVLVENMQLNEATTSHEKKSISFRYQYISGIIRPARDQAESFSDNHKQVLEIITISNGLIEKIIALQDNREKRRELEKYKNSLKKFAGELDKLYEKNARKTKDLVSDSLGQVEDLARTLGLPAKKIESIRRIEQDAIASIEADKVIQLTARKHFIALLNELEALKNQK